MSDFFKFPHTPHIAWLGNGEPRDDKVLAVAEIEPFLKHTIVTEEKVDGANLGLSLGNEGKVKVQNRGQYIHRPFTGQFSRLNEWLAIHEEALSKAMGESLIIFGEWAAAVHSLEYSCLPDYFLLFDVYDRDAQRFWSTSRRNALALHLGLRHVHQIGKGCYGLSSLKQMIATTPSVYRNGECEGIYLRYEDEDWLITRAKLVHPDFMQSIGEHWRSRSLRWNALDVNQTHTRKVPLD